MHTLKLRAVGSSTGLLLPKELLGIFGQRKAKRSMPSRRPAASR